LVARRRCGNPSRIFTEEPRPGEIQVVAQGLEESNLIAKESSFVTCCAILAQQRGEIEGVPGIFYLFCGVLFPLSILPEWGQALGKAIPLTYWFEILRRILMPPAMLTEIATTSPTTLESFGLVEVLVLLLVSATLFLVLSVGLFRLMEWLARRAGKLDMTTAY